MSDVTARNEPQGRVVLAFDEELYPKDVVLGAAYAFLDDCYVHLDREDGKILVRLRPKEAKGDWDADALAGRFESEALTLAWRRMLLQDNRELIEKVTSRVLAGAAGPAGLDDLLGEELAEAGDAFDDPLGIALSWEEKYGKQEEQSSQADGASDVRAGDDDGVVEETAADSDPTSGDRGKRGEGAGDRS